LTRLVRILLCIALFNYTASSQKLRKELLAKTWFCNCNFNSDSLVLSADNINKPICETKFSASGKLLLKNTKKKSLDSSGVCVIKKNSLILHFDAKDSVIIYEYRVKKIPEKKAFMLSMLSSSRYLKRKGDDTITMDRFTLIQGNKRKTIERPEEITIFSQKKALHNDSINLAVWGQFVGYISDTLLIDSDQFVEHNFYKKYTDSMHYIAPLLFDTVVRIKVPVKEITGMFSQREPFASVATDATFLAMGTGLLCVLASLVSKDTSTGSIFAQAGVISFLTMPVSFGFGLGFSKQKFLLTPGKKKKKVWRIERHIPYKIITQRNQKKSGTK
jgi:hypothetical protein